MPTFTRTAFALALAATSLAGCAANDDDGTTVAAEQASTTVETTAEASYVTSLVIADRDAMASVHADVAAATIAARLEAHLAAGLTVPACATITTDEQSFVQVDFADCTGPRGLVGLSGTVRAALSFETVACGAFQCVSAVVYALSTDGLTVNGTTFAGAWSLRDPLAAGPYTWTGTLSVDGNRRSVTTHSTATLAVDGACVTYDLDATVDGTVRDLAITADGVTRCLDACPTTGSVTVTGAAGALAWTYLGDGTATVTGPRGATFAVTLACAR